MSFVEHAKPKGKRKRKLKPKIYETKIEQQNKENWRKTHKSYRRKRKRKMMTFFHMTLAFLINDPKSQIGEMDEINKINFKYLSYKKREF